MATYRFSAKLISRADGRNVTAACAYRAGERIADYRTGEVFDYTRRREVLDRVIVAPENAPAWALEREQLWNAVESVEKRKDAQLAREVQVSLPHELSLEASRALLHEFVREQFVARGMVADVTIHAAHRGGDERNIHAHVLLTTRHLGPEGFVGKAREWNDRALLETWRAAWEGHVNRALELARVHDRIDHRSYAARGLDREAEPKQGPIATEMERKGRRSHAGDDRRAARERNAERDRLHDERRRIDEQLREEQRLREEARHREAERRERKTERDAHERPGMGTPDVPAWQQWREQALSVTYERDMRGTRLARFWRIERTVDGLQFSNARGQIVDEGHRVTAAHGNEIEIRGMLDIAEAKGWGELVFSGSDSFKREAMAAALERGFTIRVDGRDQELLREVEHVDRQATRDSDVRERDQDWER